VDERGRLVLSLLAEGAGTREIADEIGYSERTIKSVIQQIELELGARNRVEAVALGIRSGII
jgi:DNA-binding NarL/FixJ family response regulator